MTKSEKLADEIIASVQRCRTKNSVSLLRHRARTKTVGLPRLFLTTASMKALAVGFGVLALAPQAALADCVLDDATNTWTCSGDLLNPATPNGNGGFHGTVRPLEFATINIEPGTTWRRDTNDPVINPIQDPDNPNTIETGHVLVVNVGENAQLIHEFVGDPASGWPWPVIYAPKYIDSVEVNVATGGLIETKTTRYWGSVIEMNAQAGDLTIVVDEGGTLRSKAGRIVYSAPVGNDIDPKTGDGYDGLQGIFLIDNSGLIERTGNGDISGEVYVSALALNSSHSSYEYADYVAGEDIGSFVYNRETGVIRNTVDLRPDDYDKTISPNPNRWAASSVINFATSDTYLENYGVIENLGTGYAITSMDPVVDVWYNAGTISTEGDIAIVMFHGDDALILDTGSVINGAVFGDIDEDQPENYGWDTVILQGAGYEDDDFLKFEELTVNADGLWTLDGDLSFEQVDVNAGMLTINGALGTAEAFFDGTPTIANVNDGAYFGGDGDIHGHVTIHDGGTLSPGNSIGTMEILGDLTLSPTSTYEAEVDIFSGTSDLTTVGGTATLDGEIEVVFVPFTTKAVPTGLTLADFFVGRSYAVLSSDNDLIGAFNPETLPDATLLLSTGLEQLDRKVNVIVTGGSTCDFAGSSNQESICAPLDDLPITTDEIMGLVLEAEEDVFRHRLNLLTGEIHPSIKSALLQNSGALNDAVAQRLRATKSQASSNVTKSTDSREAGFWFSGFGSSFEADETDNTAQLDSDSNGALFGVEFDTDESDWTFGVLGGIRESDITQNDVASSASVDSQFLGVYAGTDFGAVQVSFGGAFTRNEISTARFSGMNTYEADYNSDSVQVFGELGTEFETGQWMLNPFVNLTHTQLGTDGFAETGGGAALSAEADDLSATLSTLGVRAGTSLSESFHVNGWIGLTNASGDTNPRSAFTMGNSDPFTISGAPMAENSVNFGLNLKVDLSEAASLDVSYSGRHANEASSHSIGAGFSFAF